MADITNNQANPAGALKARYRELMLIADASELSNEALKTVAGTHFSKANRARFDKAIRAEANNLDRLRFYLTNFILAAGGNAVIS